MPGAGDDEESWARGLTPALLFQHAEVSPTTVSLHLGDMPKWQRACVRLEYTQSFCTYFGL